MGERGKNVLDGLSLSKKIFVLALVSILLVYSSCGCSLFSDKFFYKKERTCNPKP
ncbi:MAG: methyl-accepting chemotaxis protein [Thermodesulfobacterium sp.]|nr:methyl-accepting chemotaxis protein [Thermodesulfobacterium sp.]